MNLKVIIQVTKNTKLIDTNKKKKKRRTTRIILPFSTLTTKTEIEFSAKCFSFSPHCSPISRNLISLSFTAISRSFSNKNY